MANLRPIYQYIGEPVMVIEPDAYTSAAMAATDNDSGVAIEGVSNVLFLLQVGDAATLTSLQVAINYSSTGNASDAGTSSDNWHATDAIFAAVDSDGVNEIYLLEVDILAKNMADEAGKLYATTTPSDAVDFGLCAISVFGTGKVPTTNENTVVFANGAP